MRLILIITILISLNARAQDALYAEQVIANYESGVVAYHNNNHDAARSYFTKCITADSSCFEAYYGLGLIHFEENKFDQSLLYANKARILRPFDSQLTGLIGRIYFQKSNYPKAETFLKRAISIGDQNTENILYLALSLQKQNNYSSALRYLNQLIASNPSEADYHYKRALLYLEMEDYSAAKVDLQNASEIADSPLENIYWNLATATLQLGEGEEFLSHIAEGLKIANRDEKILLLILKGSFYRDIGEYETAELHYNQAYALQNDNPFILMHQAAVLIDLEKYEFAIEKCDSALILNPNQSEAYFNRGIANEMIREVEQACIDWQKAFVLGSQKAIQYLNGPVCNE